MTARVVPWSFLFSKNFRWSTLHSLTMDASETRIGGDTGMAMAEMEEAATLKSGGSKGLLVAMGP